MDIQTFINNYYEAFSLKAELPIAFWYSDSLLGELKQTQGCLFKALPAIRQGEIIRYLHFARINRLTSFEKVEGLLFLATPDILSGLITWTFFDNNNPDAVSTPFGSGCSSTITLTVNENRQGGHRTFLGFFDPSVRPYVESNLLSLTIPMSRFKTMYQTMRNSSLYDTHAWAKIKTRINEG